jgi:NAD(P)-dependent dehydrogenase (short-subunit alcohol dehydrogenase family)
MAVFQSMNAIPRPWLEPEDVSKLVLFLASDDSMYMTGGEVKIDMGLTAT